MTFLTPIILGLLIISAGSGLAYLAIQIQNIFSTRFAGGFLPSYIRNIHLVSITTAIILSVLELYL
jgi:hypothetical protein